MAVWGILTILMLIYKSDIFNPVQAGVTRFEQCTNDF